MPYSISESAPWYDSAIDGLQVFRWNSFSWSWNNPLSDISCVKLPEFPWPGHKGLLLRHNIRHISLLLQSSIRREHIQWLLFRQILYERPASKIVLHHLALFLFLPDLFSLTAFVHVRFGGHVQFSDIPSFFLKTLWSGAVWECRLLSRVWLCHFLIFFLRTAQDQWPYLQGLPYTRNHYIVSGFLSCVCQSPSYLLFLSRCRWTAAGNRSHWIPLVWVHY